MGTAELTIDGRTVLADESETILEAALNAGIYIPNLCYHPDLKPLGACRLCLVEVAGMDGPVASCEEKVRPGLAVLTNTDKVKSLRRLSMEMMMADHPSDCTSCLKYGSCSMQSLIQYINPGSRMRRFRNTVPEKKNHPLFIRDMQRCIKCGRCIRICRDVRGVKAVDFYRTENSEILVGSPDDTLLLEQCRDCCACVEVCPTGALRDVQETFRIRGASRAETLVPCRAACPAHIDVARYLRFIREGRYGAAVAVIREKAPFPASLGAVCSHPCEGVCRRSFVTEAVSIRCLKRFAAENDDGSWRERVRSAPTTGKKVAVVGAGPAGLTAAYYLARKGHAVTVFEQRPEAGGMLRYGIPEFRLPAGTLDRDLEEIIGAGVTVIADTPISDIKKLTAEGFDAVLLAIGAQGGVRLSLEGGALNGVLVNIDFLRQIRMDRSAAVGRRVVVLGGGNVAFDCARTALRLGAQEVHIACLESREAMTASEEEILQGTDEGIVLHPSSSFVKILGAEKAEGVVLETVESFSFDDQKRAVIKTVDGSLRVLEADTVIFAVGQKPVGAAEFGVGLTKAGYFEVSDGASCGEEAVFAAGDAVTGTDSVIRAIAGGRLAAGQIDLFLGGDGNITEELAPDEKPDGFLGQSTGFGALHRLEPARVKDSDGKSADTEEAVFDEASALMECSRCLQCDLRTLIRPVRLWGDFSREGGGE
jgi:NADPH-dependent glutamate synthase beta subunit-like oxidoreductase/Pyruvate/2-oxoacid:ferredoxin oxidoreductase delta subunit/ferredoxin